MITLPMRHEMNVQLEHIHLSDSVVDPQYISDFLEKNLKRSFVIIAATLLASGLFASTPALAAAPSTPQSVDGVSVQVSSVKIKSREQLTEFVESDTPKEILIDSESGEMISVTDQVNPRVKESGVDKVCSSKTSCFASGKIPYADYGFTGKGTHKGTWTYRIEFRSGPFTAKAWYKKNGTSVGWGPKVGPGSTVRMNKPETGIQVTIY